MPVSAPSHYTPGFAAFIARNNVPPSPQAVAAKTTALIKAGNTNPRNDVGGKVLLDGREVPTMKKQLDELTTPFRREVLKELSRRVVGGAVSLNATATRQLTEYASLHGLTSLSFKGGRPAAAAMD